MHFVIAIIHKAHFSGHTVNQSVKNSSQVFLKSRPAISKRLEKNRTIKLVDITKRQAGDDTGKQ